MRRVLILCLVVAGCEQVFGLDEETEEIARTITMARIQLDCTPHGGGSFGKDCTGFVEVSASPAFPANHRLGVILNASSIGGETRTTGTAVTRVPLDGDAIGCPFSQPSHISVHDDTHDFSNPLAIIEFRWTTGTLCSQW